MLGRFPEYLLLVNVLLSQNDALSLLLLQLLNFLQDFDFILCLVDPLLYTVQLLFTFSHFLLELANFLLV